MPVHAFDEVQASTQPNTSSWELDESTLDESYFTFPDPPRKKFCWKKASWAVFAFVIMFICVACIVRMQYVVTIVDAAGLGLQAAVPSQTTPAVVKKVVKPIFSPAEEKAINQARKDARLFAVQDAKNAEKSAQKEAKLEYKKLLEIVKHHYSTRTAAKAKALTAQQKHAKLLQKELAYFNHKAKVDMAREKAKLKRRNSGKA